jgi:hypothetical protein
MHWRKENVCLTEIKYSTSTRDNRCCNTCSTLDNRSTVNKLCVLASVNQIQEELDAQIKEIIGAIDIRGSKFTRYKKK